MLQSWGEMLQKDKGEKCKEKAELLGSALLSGRGALPGQESTAEGAARILLRDSGSAPDASRPAACLLSSCSLSQETDNDHFP